MWAIGAVGMFTAFACVAVVVATLVCVGVAARARVRRSGPPTWAFFHPYCAQGGGGERVSTYVISEDHRSIQIFSDQLRSAKIGSDQIR